MPISKEMMIAAAKAYHSVAFGLHPHALRAALESVLSAAEPVAWLVKRYDLKGVLLDTELSFVRPTIKSTCRTDMVPLYAAPPAPSVTVEALRQAASDFMHLFIQDGQLTVQGLEDTDLIQAYEKLSAALSAQVQDVAEERYRHKKRGSTYTVIARGRLQVDGDLDNEKVVVYRGDDGQMWVRPEYEFNDGRFEPLHAAPAKQEGDR